MPTVAGGVDAVWDQYQTLPCWYPVYRDIWKRVRGYKLVVHDHHGRSADCNELLNSFQEGFIYPPSPDTAALALWQRDLRAFSLYSPRVVPHRVISACLWCSPVSLLQHGLCSKTTRGRSEESCFQCTLSGYLRAPLGSSVCAGPGLLLCDSLSQCHSQTLLHQQTFADEAKIFLALGDGTRPKSSPKC